MAIYREGISTSNGTNNINRGNSDVLKDLITTNSSLFKIVRVLDIVLDENHPKFFDVGEWNGIGTIYFEEVSTTEKIPTFAYPLNPQIKYYPLINEIVLLVSIPSKFISTTKFIKPDYYYFLSTGIWNHPHHNAYPDITSYEALTKNQKDDYVNAEGNYVRRIEDNSTEINLNYTNYPNPSQDTFQEKSNIHSILSFAGDTIYEGRWGQSLRFGSTAKSKSTISNNWSTAGNNGDPITILRNGQPINSSDRGWIPITENISNDLSSIYLTSYQQLNTFRVASELYQSYKTPPTFPSQYKNPQVILNSDRIVINAKSDSILLSAQQSIGMSTNGSVNIDAVSHYISSNDIKLGSKNATQPVLLGNDTIELLRDLTFAVKDLASILQVQRDYPGGVLATSYNSIAGNALICLDSIINSLNDNSLKSKTTKVQ